MSVVFRGRRFTKFLVECTIRTQLVVFMEWGHSNLADSSLDRSLLYWCMGCILTHPGNPISEALLDPAVICHWHGSPQMVPDALGNNLHRIQSSLGGYWHGDWPCQDWTITREVVMALAGCSWCLTRGRIWNDASSGIHFCNLVVDWKDSHADAHGICVDFCTSSRFSHYNSCPGDCSKQFGSRGCIPWLFLLSPWRFPRALPKTLVLYWIIESTFNLCWIFHVLSKGSNFFHDRDWFSGTTRKTLSFESILSHIGYSW